MPQKDLIKTAFTLQPYGNQLPIVTQQDGFVSIEKRLDLPLKMILQTRALERESHVAS